MNLVILAGGMGTRLWPLSRENNPKQFQKLVFDQPLLLQTYNRLIQRYPEDKIFVSTIPMFRDAILTCLPDFDERRIIEEPMRRDTGPAMGFVASYFDRSAPDETLAFIPSDHCIRNDDNFLEALRVGDDLVQETGKLLDIGILPYSPSSSYGYTRVGKRIRIVGEIDIYEFLGHKEKPSPQVAKEYLSAGGYLWHGSYYMWTPRRFLDAYRNYDPETYDLLMKIREKFDSDLSAIPDLFSRMKKISIDYAVTEKMNAEDVLIIEGRFGWNDVGCYDRLYEHVARDAEFNAIKGDAVLVDSRRCFVVGSTKPIAAIGLEDIVIIDSHDSLLVCPVSRAEDLKKLVEEVGKRYPKLL